MVFGNQKTPPPAPPGDDSHGDAVPVPVPPPAHQFRVTRWSVVLDELETVKVEAHVVSMNEAGNILRFAEYYINPHEGPSTRIVRCFNGWIDYEEIKPVEQLIIVPGVVLQ